MNELVSLAVELAEMQEFIQVIREIFTLRCRIDLLHRE